MCMLMVPKGAWATSYRKKKKASQRATFRLAFQPGIYSFSSNEVGHLMQKSSAAGQSSKFYKFAEEKCEPPHAHYPQQSSFCFRTPQMMNSSRKRFSLDGRKVIGLT